MLKRTSAMKMHNNFPLDNVVRLLLSEVPVDAKDLEVQVNLGGISGNKFDVIVEGRRLPVCFIPSTNENIDGMVRIAYSEGILESIQQQTVPNVSGMDLDLL